MNDWLGLLTPPPPAPKKSRNCPRHKTEHRTLEQKKQHAARICASVFRARPYPSEEAIMERLQDEAQMLVAQSRNFVNWYRKNHDIK